MREKFHSLVGRFQAVKTAWPKPPTAMSPQEQVWFAGLAVSPVEFSRQLTSLQLSLQREKAPEMPGADLAATVGPNSISEPCRLDQ